MSTEDIGRPVYGTSERWDPEGYGRKMVDERSEEGQRRELHPWAVRLLEAFMWTAGGLALLLLGVIVYLNITG